MNQQLKYVPIFRGRMQELKVVQTFDFRHDIYPYIEIIKEIDRRPPERKATVKPLKAPAIPKTFEDVYLPVIKAIKAQKVFIDLPVHIRARKGMDDSVIEFFRRVIENRESRTKYMLKFSGFKDKVIPVISTYHGITGEIGSIEAQVEELRAAFPTLAFRTFMNTFPSDIDQIERAAQAGDFLIMDWQETILDLDDEDQLDIIARLKQLRCSVVAHRNPIPNDLTNKNLAHDARVAVIDNSLMNRYMDFGGHCFSDYAGIKRGDLTTGGGPESESPGFLYYDATSNEFFGYRGKVQKWTELTATIVPDVIASDCSSRMRGHEHGYLGPMNNGWALLNAIQRGEQSGNSAAKFKSIGMYHYLHCMEMKIANGVFNHA